VIGYVDKFASCLSNGVSAKKFDQLERHLFGWGGGGGVVDSIIQLRSLWVNRYVLHKDPPPHWPLRAQRLLERSLKVLQSDVA